MSIFDIILIFIGSFVSILFWRRDNKIALILSVILTILILIFPTKIKIPFGSTISQINKTANDLPFISSKWKDSTLVYSGSQIRIGMINDFIKNYKPYHKHETEILKLLGKPDYSDDLKEWDLVYWLGEESGLINNRTRWFAIEFDSSGKVSEYQIFRY
jgi:hypothetical protein